METRKQHIKIIISCSLLLFTSGFSFLVLADENKHAAVDQAIGGMEQGRRISSQGTYNNKGITSGNPRSSSIGNHGYIFTGGGLSNTSQANNPLTTDTTTGTLNNPIVSVKANVNPSSGTGSSGTQVGSTSETTQPVTGTVGQTVPEQISGSVNVNTGEEVHGNGGMTQESSGTSSNPIIGVEAGTNPASGTPNAGIHVDTSGQLEDRQILDAGIVSGTGSSGAEVGSATDITGQELVHEADITTEPIAGTGPIAPEQISTGSSTTAQEPAGTSGNPIVGVEAGRNPESGIPNVGVAVDTTGELEDKQILQTDLATESIASSEQVGSASDITGSIAVHEADVTTQPVSSTTGQTVPGTTEVQTGSSSATTTTQEPAGTSGNPIVSVEAGTNPESGTVSTGAQSDIPIPSDLSAEVDTTGQTVGGTADIGEEAEVSGISEGEDVTCNPTDGLTSTACGSLKL